MQLPPPVRSWLKGAALKGKTLHPFNTHAGYGVGSGFEEIRQICQQKGCTVSEGLSLKGGVERDGVKFVMQGACLQEVERRLRDWLLRK